MNEDKKIVLLERLLTAIVGRQEAKVEYRDIDGLLPQVIVECDPDDVVKIKSALSTANIEFDFYVTEREVPEKDRSTIFPLPYEGICEVTFYLDEDYYSANIKLKEELELKNKEIEKLKRILPIKLCDLHDMPQV
jgi:hypothetical protein